MFIIVLHPNIFIFNLFKSISVRCVCAINCFIKLRPSNYCAESGKDIEGKKLKIRQAESHRFVYWFEQSVLKESVLVPHIIAAIAWLDSSSKGKACQKTS